MLHPRFLLRFHQIALSVICILASGCVEKQRVGEHQFVVPAESLIPKSDYPFFLPRSKDEGFIFILNPEDELTDQHTVLVQERSLVCARASGSNAFVNFTICPLHEIAWIGRHWIRSGDATFWTYSPETQSGSKAPFVSCHKMEVQNHPGLCSATLLMDDLALTIGLDDDEIHDLERIYDQAVADLRHWER